MTITNGLEKQVTRLLRQVMGPICSHPTELTINCEEGHDEYRFVCHPHIADYPKLVGAQGTIIKSIEFLFGKIDTGEPRVVGVELIKEPCKGKPEGRVKIPDNPDFDDHFLLRLVDNLLDCAGAINDGCSVAAGSGTRLVDIKPMTGHHISQDIVEAINTIAHAWGRAQGAGNISVRLESEPDAK